MTTPKKNATEPPAHGRKTPARYFSRAIGNALRVLEILQQSSRPLALTDVTQQAKLPKSSAFRILRTLEIAGYLQRVEGDRFAPSQAVATMPNRLASQLLAVAPPLMKQLNNEFGETISLALLFENHIEVIAVIESPHRVNMINFVGGIIPPHASSLGKCITAFQPEGRGQKLLRAFGLPRFTPNTIVQEPAISKELELVRARGYGTDFEESTLGGCCLSAPIFGKEGNAVAAVSISMPKMRFTTQERLIAAVCDAAAAITLELRGN
ncbi:MAG: IclR family transcriptional regulator [Bryobacteraceae bacterium]|jgi:IclR family acetate operon transcriptional repressor